MSIYKAKNGVWYASIYIDGRRHRKSLETKNKSEAIAAEAAIRSDTLRGKYNFDRKLKVKFSVFKEEFLKYAKINKRSWIRDECSLKHLSRFYDDLFLTEITPQRLENYKDKRLKSGAMPGTINRELVSLRSLFNVAKKYKKFEADNPLREVKLLQERPYVMKILTKEEIERLLGLSKRHVRQMILLALNTGMRKGEIFGLKWNDIDFIHDYILLKKTKSNVMRKVPMNSVIRNIFKGMERTSDLVFCNPKTGNQFTSVFRAFKNACKKAGVPDLRFHDLRHTAATFMVQSGIDLVTVSEILGHADITMTRKYCHPTPEHKRRAVDALGDIFKSEKPKKSHSMVIGVYD